MRDAKRKNLIGLFLSFKLVSSSFLYEYGMYTHCVLLETKMR